MIISAVKESNQGGYSATIDGVEWACVQTSSRFYPEILKWIAAGNTPEPEFTESEILDNARSAKVKLIKTEALSRISTAVPALNTLDMVAFMVDLWPMLNTASANADITLAKDTYVYTKTKIIQAQGATQQQLDAYDPLTDTGWPA